MALIDDAPRQLQAILDLHGIEGECCEDLTGAQRAAILTTLYQILDIIDAKTNSVLTINMMVLTAQVFLAGSSFASGLPRAWQSVLLLAVVVPLLGTGWALLVFHVQGGTFLRWRGAGCTLTDGKRVGVSKHLAMWSEFRNLALICDQRCRRHARIRAWTIASGVVFLSTILIVVAKILCFDSVAAVSSSAPARSELFVGLAELPAADRHLLERARAVSRRAYAPYSGFGVGAAVRTRSGAVYAGANMENASYGLTLCAETSALLQTVAADDFAVEAIAIVGGRLDGAGGPGRPVTPCGRCRQLIVEAAQVANTDVRVIAANADLSRVTVRTIGELLPEAFGPRDLG